MESKSAVIVSGGLGYMAGVLFGAIVAASLAAWQPDPGPPGPQPAIPKCGKYRVEFNGNPGNWAELNGCIAADGVLTWYPDEQRYTLHPYDGVAYKDRAADQWISGQINDRAVWLWGWKSQDGKPHWRISDQRTSVLSSNSGAVTTPANYGVVASKLQGPAVIASDPAEKAKVKTLMETKAGATSASSDSNCDPKPEKIPVPPLSRGIDLNWRLIAEVVFAAFALMVGAAFAVAAVIVVARNRRQAAS